MQLQCTMYLSGFGQNALYALSVSFIFKTKVYVITRFGLIALNALSNSLEPQLSAPYSLEPQLSAP